MTTDFDSVDYFTDPSLVPDPHPYYDHVRAKDPVCCPINNGVLAVTGWEAANSVYKDTENYSSCVAVMGPFTPIPFTPEGDDICAQLEEHRTEIPMFEHMVTMDPPQHTDARSILSPAADTQAAQGERGLHVAAGRPPHRRVHRRRQVRVPRRVRQAVLAPGRRRPARRPEEDHEDFREAFGAGRPGTNIGGLDHEVIAANPLAWADEKFTRYIEERREYPATTC